MSKKCSFLAIFERSRSLEFLSNRSEIWQEESSRLDEQVVNLRQNAKTKRSGRKTLLKIVYSIFDDFSYLWASISPEPDFSRTCGFFQMVDNYQDYNILKNEKIP